MNSGATKRKRITRWRADESESAMDSVAVEEPLEIRINNQPISVTMRTPGDDEELVAGFLFSEGIIRNRTAIEGIDAHPRNRFGNIVNVSLSDEQSVNWDRLKRSFLSTSSCGLCGRESIEAVRQRVSRVNAGFALPRRLLASLPGKLAVAQAAFSTTGGLHAVALFDSRGRLSVAREDIGRHNAVDKVIGWGVLNNKLPFAKYTMLVSGRASFEIVQKSLVAGVPMLCAISAPSNMAVELSRASGQTLVGFLRDEQMNIYSGGNRVAD